MAAKLTVKKILTYVGMGIGALALTGGVVYLASPPQPTSPSEASAPAASLDELLPSEETIENDVQEDESPSIGTATEDKELERQDLLALSQGNLERLQNREREIAAVYEGSEVSQYQGEDEPLVLDGGQFSDFDTRPATEPQNADNSNDRAPAPEQDAREARNDSSALAADALPDAGSSTPSSSNGTWGDGFSPDESLTNALPVDATPQVGVDQLIALEDKVDQLSQDLLSKTAMNDLASSAAIEAMQSSIDQMADRLSSFESRLGEAAQLNQIAFSEELESWRQSMQEQLDELSAKQQTSAVATSSAPSVNVTSLYRLDSIRGGSAVLVGQNTGRVYEIPQGGSLAYGGRLARIQGDRVELVWPHRTVTLSVFD